MSFGDAVSSFFRNYVGFSGRATRAEYWWVVLFIGIVFVPVVILDGILFPDILLEQGIGVFSGLASLALFLPSLALTVRRLHDVGMSGWLVLLGIIPFLGSIFFFVISLIDSQKGTNKYGTSTKYPATGIA